MTKDKENKDEGHAREVDNVSSYGISDEDFEELMSQDLQKDPLSKEYPDVFRKAPGCVTKWRQRYRGDPTVWKRLFHKDRVLKEFIEAAPTIDAVQRFVENAATPNDEMEKFTVIENSK